MPISKRKAAKITASKKYIKETRDKILDKYGYTKLKAKHGKSMPPAIPDYRVESKYALSDTIGNGFKRKSAAHHPDAQEFEIYEGHKSNPMLMTKFDGRIGSGGKKPN